MSSLHLTTGSKRPAKVEDKLRLYSMEYCPFAHRARLVLLAKNVPHDIVNVNLINKPEWLTDLHPEGKVPALDTGSKIVVESTEISDYLDETYPEPALYPTDPEGKEKDKELITQIGSLVKIFAGIIHQTKDKELKSVTEWKNELMPLLAVFENTLKERGTKFFRGNDFPGMVDYMLWPFAERAKTTTIVLGENLLTDGDREQIPLLRSWAKAMITQSAVTKTYHGPEKFYKVVLIKVAGNTPDYDSI